MPRAPRPLRKAEHPGHIWALDFQHDATEAGTELRFLTVIDEFTREALAIRVSRSFTADETAELLEALTARYGQPGFIRLDNGPELTAIALRGWCESSEVKTTYIQPGDGIRSHAGLSPSGSEKRGPVSMFT